MNDTTQQLVDDYLDRLERELADLPRARRRELVGEIAEHIAEARADLPPQAGEADVLTLLDRIGDPADIADEARERVGVARPAARTTWREIAAVILLPIGGVVLPAVGWVVGVVLLWASDAWSTRDKLIGTLIVPGGLVPATFLMTFAGYSTSGGCVRRVVPPGPEVCTSSGGGTPVLAIAALVVLVVGPLASAAYLAFRLRSATARAAPVAV